MYKRLFSSLSQATSFFLLGIVTLLSDSSYAANPIYCTSVANQVLQNMNLGTFSKPRFNKNKDINDPTTMVFYQTGLDPTVFSENESGREVVRVSPKSFGGESHISINATSVFGVRSTVGIDLDSNCEVLRINILENDRATHIDPKKSCTEQNPQYLDKDEDCKTSRYLEKEKVYYVCNQFQNFFPAKKASASTGTQKRLEKSGSQ